MSDKLLIKYLQVTGACADILERQQRGELSEEEAQALIDLSKANRTVRDWEDIRDYQDDCCRSVYKFTKKGWIQPASGYVPSHPNL
jgi:hypothetical protein